MKKQLPTKPWDRAIILVDMNAFFASVEQRDHPELHDKPVAVTNGTTGTCIITSSYAARAYGIKTGMRLPEAYKLCPHLIRCPARPKRYAEVSKKIMRALENVTPDIEIFSVDEAFLDVTRCQALHGSPENMAFLAKEQVFVASGLLCSVGVSGDKTTAKYAAKLQKPNGLTVIPPWEAKAQLKNVPVTDLCGIAGGIAAFLAQYNVYHCGDMEKIPISVLARRFGNLGRRIWYMCQGADPEPVHMNVDPPKSMGHGKVMPPNTRDKQIILSYLLHMSEKLAARLRKHHLKAQRFFIGLHIFKQGWLTSKEKSIYPTHDGADIYALCKFFVEQHWKGQAVSQVQVTALDPKPEALQLDFFQSDPGPANEKNQAVDKINQRYGEFTVAPARLLDRSEMPNVISPAWKPGGHRDSI